MQPAAAIRSSGAGSNKIADLPVHAHALPARRACSDRAATHWQNGQRPRGEPAATVPQTHSDCKANAQQSRCNRACIYMQIYSVCIQYSPCICDMDCLISGAYVSAYVSCMCFTYIQIFQSICVCMCLYVNGIQDHTCRYVHVCISYTPCICDMDCLISGAYVRAYVSCMCFTYIQIFQSICVCMCLYVNGIQDHMHLIQPLSERRYIQIHAYTCRYIDVCIQYRPCICDMDCLISGAYNRAYVSCMCSKYIQIFQSICVLYVLQIHAHMHWQDH